MELRIENLENDGGNVLDTANGYLIAMYDDLVKRAQIVAPEAS